MTVPLLNLYGKYGDPKKLVEFRLFSFNSCSAGCKNCFYRKTDNNFLDFAKVDQLAADLLSNEYALETVYLLPTDVFETEFNFRIFKDPHLKSVLKKFRYVGFASTLKNGFNRSFLDELLSEYSHLKIEMHVNLLEEQLFNEAYIAQLSTTIEQLKDLYQDRILINLAINSGTQFSKKELERITELVEKLSDDKILEINFTYLFNSKMSLDKKTTLMKDSYDLMGYFSKEFDKNEKAFNSRTLVRKPSFVFKDDRVYLSPIIPFDEYVFIDDKKFQLKQPTFQSFIEVYSQMEMDNLPLFEECETCDFLSVCHGKSFFSVAKYYNLPCIKEGVVNDYN